MEGIGPRYQFGKPIKRITKRRRVIAGRSVTLATCMHLCNGNPGNGNINEVSNSRQSFLKRNPTRSIEDTKDIQIASILCEGIALSIQHS